ncbi:MAG: glycerol kinase GlpK [Candidatus Kariarchaeaceae archaeon]
MGYIISIDQGTSSTRSIIFDGKANTVGSAQKEHQQYYPKEAWVEHNPLEIKQSVLDTMTSAIEQARVSWKDIDAIGITNQRETVVPWNKHSGLPLENAIVWQCRRTTPIVQQLQNDGYKDLFHKKTGLILDAYFSGTKMKWLLNNSDKVRDCLKLNRLAFGTIDSWIVYFLSSSHRTDASNASRTLLYDLNENNWSEELCQILGIPMETLPTIHENASEDPFGYYTIDGCEIPIRSVLGDQQAALFGQVGLKTGSLKTTYGTGNFTLLNTGKQPKFSTNGLLTTVGWEVDNQQTYALEGSVFITGAVLQWLRDKLGIFQTYDQIDDIVKDVTDTGGVVFVPAFVGLGAPYWDSSARGLLIGLTQGTDRSHIIQAALNSIAFQTQDLLSTMVADTGINISEMRVDGGITQSDTLMQKQSDVSQINISRPYNIETTALGAGLMAGYNLIWETFDELKDLNPVEYSWEPQKENAIVQNEIDQWHAAIEKSRNWV